MRNLNFSDRWLDEFDRRPFHFLHELAEHDALTFDSLREVVLSLPRDQIFASRADLRIDADFDKAHKEHTIAQSLEATLADMATTNSYVMVRKPDAHPRLREILSLFITELRASIHAAQAAWPDGPGAKMSDVLHDPMLYLFISSPNSVTPFHVDRYSTLLLQLQGEKKVMIWDRRDRSVVTEEELESLFGEPHVKNPSYKGANSGTPYAARLRRGEGVHIPFTAPHWVKNGDEVSVSISFICKTDFALRDAEAYTFNHRWRKLLARVPSPLPRPAVTAVGESPIVDAAKARLYRSISGARRRLRATP